MQDKIQNESREHNQRHVLSVVTIVMTSCCVLLSGLCLYVVTMKLEVQPKHVADQVSNVKKVLDENQAMIQAIASRLLNVESEQQRIDEVTTKYRIDERVRVGEENHIRDEDK